MANPFASILPAMKAAGGSEKPEAPDAMRKISMAVPSYKKGTRYVPKTGLAKLEKGEAVLNKKQAKRYRGASRALGAGKERKPTKTEKLTEEAGHELKVNPPKILAETAKKKGPRAAAKQKVAIMLSKARAAGAHIPEKK